MINASLRYDLENIDNLRYLLCLAREFFAETGMIPTTASRRTLSSRAPSTNRHTSSVTNADSLTEAGS